MKYKSLSIFYCLIFFKRYSYKKQQKHAFCVDFFLFFLKIYIEYYVLCRASQLHLFCFVIIHIMPVPDQRLRLDWYLTNQKKENQSQV